MTKIFSKRQTDLSRDNRSVLFPPHHPGWEQESLTNQYAHVVIFAGLATEARRRAIRSVWQLWQAGRLTLYNVSDLGPVSNCSAVMSFKGWRICGGVARES